MLNNKEKLLGAFLLSWFITGTVVIIFFLPVTLPGLLLGTLVSYLLPWDIGVSFKSGRKD